MDKNVNTYYNYIYRIVKCDKYINKKFCSAKAQVGMDTYGIIFV